MPRLPLPRRSLCPALAILAVVTATAAANASTGGASAPPEVNTNQCPVVSPITGKTIAEGAFLTFTPTATDADGDALTFSILGLPPGAAVNPTSGTFSWTPGYDQAGTYNATYLVADTHGCASPSNQFTITVTNANGPPTVNPIPDQTTTENVLLSVVATATDPDNDQLQWSGSSLPSGASVNIASGTLTWRPSFTQAGYYSGVTMIASDGISGSGSANFAISVENANGPPVVDPIADQAVGENSTLTVWPSASDPDGDQLTWSASNLPSGSNVDPWSGVFSWTPTFSQSGIYLAVTLTASDGIAGSSSASFTITVSNVNDPPVVAPISNRSVAENAILTVVPSANDPDGNTLTWSGSGLPAGSNVNPSTGTLTWTPTFTQAGTYSGVTLIATDTYGSTGSASFEITVTNTNRPPTVAPLSNRTISENALLTVTPSVSDPDGDLCTWSGTAIPSGAAVNPTSGVLTWHPGSNAAGSYPAVTLTATDPGGLSGSTSFTITVTDVVIATGEHCDGGSLFGAPNQYPAQVSQDWVSTGDFTGDGIRDLIVRTQDYNSSPHTPVARVYPGLTSAGLPTGRFGSMIWSGLPRMSDRPPAVGDFNGDGAEDLAYVSGDSVVIALATELSTMRGSFVEGRAFYAGTGGGEVATGDFDKDGILDLAVAGNSGSSAWSIGFLRGVGDGTFASCTRPQSWVPPYSYFPQLGDLNGDGNIDMLFYNGYYGSYLWILTGSGDGSFTGLSQVSCGGAYCLRLADADLDGLLDVYEMEYGRLRIFRNASAPGSNTVSLVAAGDWAISSESAGFSSFQPLQFALADVNLDGRVDLIWPSYMHHAELNESDSRNAVAVAVSLPANGSGQLAFEPPARFPVAELANGGQTQWVAASDLNGDGLSDLVTVGRRDFFVSCCGQYSSTMFFSVAFGNCVDSSKVSPSIAGVRDVPNDQGGHVAVLWSASAFDHAGAQEITGYRVWRRIPARAGTTSVTKGPAGPSQFRITTHAGINGSVSTTYWEALTELPAAALSGYAYVAPTTQDSIGGSNPYTAFFVSALTADPAVFYDAPVDSGYSVDNLAPATPQGLMGQFQASNALRLHWKGGVDADLSQYAIYRSTDPTFPSGSTSRIASRDTFFVDNAWSPNLHYRVIAQDVHGNESVPATLDPEAIVSVMPGQTRNGYGLRLVSSVGSRFTIEATFALPSRVTVTITDVRGRTLRTLLTGPQQAGALRLEWNGRDDAGRTVGRGVYIVQLQGAGTVLAAKVVRAD